MKHIALTLLALTTSAACGTTNTTTRASDSTEAAAATLTPHKGLGKLTGPAQVDCDATYTLPVTRNGKVYGVGTVHIAYTQLITQVDNRIHTYAKVSFDGEAPMFAKDRYSIYDGGSLATAGYVAVIEESGRVWSFQYNPWENSLRAGVPANSDPALDVVPFGEANCREVQYSQDVDRVVHIQAAVGNPEIESYAGIDGSPSPLDFAD